MKNSTPEIIEQAKTANSAEELLALTRENGHEITMDEARDCFARVHSEAVELDDDLLEGVSGGLVQLVNPSSSRL